jgi:hypothetical protein
MVVQVVIRGNKKRGYLRAKESAAPELFSTWLAGQNRVLNAKQEEEERRPE